MGGLVSFTFVEGTILSRSGKCGIMLDRLRVPYPRLVLDGIEDVVDGKPQRGEVLLRSEWIWRENQERLLLEDGLLPVLVVGMGRSLAMRAHPFFVIAVFEKVVD